MLFIKKKIKICNLRRLQESIRFQLIDLFLWLRYLQLRRIEWFRIHFSCRESITLRLDQDHFLQKQFYRRYYLSFVLFVGIRLLKLALFSMK